MAKKKHFNIIMAGVISGIVAITTATLGLTGTVIGSVLSSIIYQVLSTYSEEKIATYSGENIEFKHSPVGKKKNIGGEVVYLLPLIVITLIELIYLLSTFHYNFVQIFNLLESATDQNLFRVMGVGMILLSIYPFTKSNNIPRKNGLLVFFTGGILLVRGLIDVNNEFFFLAAKVFGKLDFFIGLIILLLLLIVIIGVLSSIFRSPEKEPSARNVYHNGYGRNNNYYNNPKGYNPLDFDELEVSHAKRRPLNKKFNNDPNFDYQPRIRVLNDNYQDYNENINQSNINIGKTGNASNKAKKFFNNKFDDERRR
jgi:hypothetical protein